MSENTPELSFENVKLSLNIPTASNDYLVWLNDTDQSIIVNFGINQNFYNDLSAIKFDMVMDVGFFNQEGIHSYTVTCQYSFGNGNGNGKGGGVSEEYNFGFNKCVYNTASEYGSWSTSLGKGSVINHCGNYQIQFKQDYSVWKETMMNLSWINKIIFSFRGSQCDNTESFFSLDFPGFNTSEEYNENDFTFVGTGEGIRIYDDESVYFTSLGINCLIKGTNILTPQGNIKIEDLKRGDIILNSNNQEKKIKKIYKQVVDVDISKSNRDMYKDKYSLKGDTELIVSGGHMVKLDGEYHLPIISSRFENIQKENSANEYYHLELTDYDFFIANGIEVESLCNDEEKKEKYYSDKGLSYKDLIKSKK